MGLALRATGLTYFPSKLQNRGPSMISNIFFVKLCKAGVPLAPYASGCEGWWRIDDRETSQTTNDLHGSGTAEELWCMMTARKAGHEKSDTEDHREGCSNLLVSKHAPAVVP